jgi:hypothetical protein
MGAPFLRNARSVSPDSASPVAPHIIEAIALHRADEVHAALTTAPEQVSQTQDYQFVMNKATNTTLRKTKST